MSSLFLTQTQKEDILSVIPSNGISAIELSKKTGYDRKVINNLLYTLSGIKVYRIAGENSLKPIWKLMQTVIEDKLSTGNVQIVSDNKINDQGVDNNIPTLILIDLGNVHDCLQKLEAYDKIVIGYCNTTYNGYGVSEPCENENISIKKFDTKDTNAVTSEIFYSVSIALASKIKSKIIVVSNGKIFSYLPTLAKNHGKDLELARDWTSLKPLLL